MKDEVEKRDARVAFTERFAAALAESGFPRMPARVFAALVATDSGALTSAQLADLLRVSPAAISGAVRYLVQVNLASRETARGSRREVYRVHNEVWYEAVASKDRTLERCERTLREGIDAIGRQTPAGRRIAETISFFDFLKVELPKLLERWRQRLVPISSSYQRGKTRGFEHEQGSKQRAAGRGSAARS
jgi:DNA-binding transcriptional regulator GbsR (MarR family)